jgi:uncharacterized cupin superfamily protein
VIVPPGKAAWPVHFHHANEEMFYIIEGNGTLKYGDQEYPLRAGDVVCCPPGSRKGHQIRNDSSSDLVYLGVSTREYPEIAEYPDSKKMGVVMPAAPDAGRPFDYVLYDAKTGNSVKYWDGEE